MLIYAIILLVILIVWLIVLAVKDDIQAAKRRAFVKQIHKELEEGIKELDKQPESEDGIKVAHIPHGFAVKVSMPKPVAQKKKVVAKKKVATKKKVVAKK